MVAAAGRRAAGWAVLAVAVLTPAATTGAGLVQGYVIAPATGRRLAGVPVSLMTAQLETLAVAARQTTDGDGAFAFRDPRLTDTTRFALAASYQGVMQQTSTLTVGQQQQVIVEVYEPSIDDANLTLTNLTVFVSARPDTVEVVEVAQIKNPGNCIVVGRGPGAGVTRFALPPGAVAVRGLTGQIVSMGPDVVGDDQPLPPGLTEVAIACKLPAVAAGGTLAVRTSYPAQAVEVLVQPIGWQAAAPWEDLGQVAIEGASYRRFRHPSLAAGELAVLPLPAARGRRGWLPWAGMVGCFGLVGAGWWALRRHGRATVRATPEPGRDALVARIARLDEMYQNRAEEAVYLQQRAELVARALAAPGSERASGEPG